LDLRWDRGLKGHGAKGAVAAVTWERYVAIGDSQTEGLHDYGDDGVPRGWADRLAERLALSSPGLRYANLAVRGKRSAQIRAEQLEAALALRPDLASVVSGVNDVLLPGADTAAVVGEIEEMYAALRGIGCTVVGCTFPLPSVGLTRRLRPRVQELNAAIRRVAATHQVLTVELEDVAAASDLRLWAADRIHLNPLGHERLGNAFWSVLHDLSDESWREPLPPAPSPSRAREVFDETSWVLRYLVPKIVRTARGRSSGDGCVAKRPELTPVAAGRNCGPRRSGS